MEEFSTLDIALKYAELGFPVLPLVKNTKIPVKSDNFSNGFKSATTDQSIIADYWLSSEQAISSNIGIRTGKDSGLVVLDIDIHEEDGYKTLETLENHFEKLPDTLRVKTASGGLHIYFRYPEGLTIERQINKFNGIDIIAENSYIVAAPSKIDKKSYKRVSGNITELAELPQFLLDTLATSTDNQSQQNFKMPENASVNTRKVKYTATFLQNMVSGAKEGNRNDFLMRFVSKCLALGTDLETIYTLLLVVNENFIDIPLAEKEVNTIFKSMVKKETRREVII